MTDRESFLARWSRRKSEPAEPEKTADAPSIPDTPETAPLGSPQPAASTMPPPRPARVGPSETAFDPASLPPIESITAQTDIRPFLAPGVPDEFKRAALRRAWSADPAIRDFVGLSENSDDFNTPGALGGFGPLRISGDLRRIVAQLFTPAPEQNTALQQKSEALEVAAQQAPEEVQAPAGHEGEAQGDESPQHPPSPRPVDAVAAQNESTAGEKSLSPPRRSRGGALPK